MSKMYRRHWDQMAAYSPARIAYLRKLDAERALNAAGVTPAPQPEHYNYVTRRWGGIVVYDHYVPGNPNPERIEVLDGSPKYRHIQDVNAAMVTKQQGAR